MSGRRSLTLVALAIVGFAISAYLTLFQVGIVGAPWDPLFGDGSRRVLTSAISRLLPVPDASLGAAAYAVDAVLAGLVAARAWRTWLLASALAVVASGGALVAVALAALQPITVGTFCTLCLCSSAVSVALAIGAVTEAREWLASVPHRQSLREVQQ